MAEVGKAGTGNEADIAGADHGNAHLRSIMEVANRIGQSRTAACIADVIASGERRQLLCIFCDRRFWPID
jgi:hypothetical protein